MASLSRMHLINLYKLSPSFSAAASATTSATRIFPSPSRFTFRPVRSFSTNSHGVVFTQFTPQSSDGFHAKNHPFQCNGPTGAMGKLGSVHEEMFVRVDMPGVVKEGVKVWGENQDKVFFSGEALKEWEYEESGRSYAGCFDLGCGCCHVKGVKASVENGVVWISVS